MNLLKSQLKNIPLLVNGVNAYREKRKKDNYKAIFRELSLPKKPTRKVLIYPDRPSKWSGIRSVLNILNFELTHDVNDDFLFAIKWHDTTFKETSDLIQKVAESAPVLNINSVDISKYRVDQLFKEIFGYCTQIDPRVFQGQCVKKSDINSLHDGKIVFCPIETVQDDSIYQILINNRAKGEYVEDIRVPFYKDHIPFVYLKYKLIEHQFASKTQKVVLKKTGDVFSNEEIEKIIQLALKMKLDFAEMDVLRHRSDNRIYVIDVNDTPGGLPKNTRGTDILTATQKKEVLYKMTLAFYNSFLREIY